MLLRPRWRKITREIGQNKARNILVVLSMMVGVFAIGFVVNLHHILLRDMTASYLASSPASAIYYVDVFDAELVETIRQMPAVRDVEGRTTISLRFQAGPSEWRNLTLFAMPDYDDARINQLVPGEGVWPPANRAMLVERSSLDFLRAGIGDTVRIRTATGQERDLPVIGQVYDVNQRSAELRGRAYGYVTMESLEWLGEPDGFNQLYITVADNETNPAHVLNVVRQVRTRIEKNGYTVRFIEMPPLPGKHPDSDKVQAIAFILAFIGIFSLLSSTLLVVNTISFLLMQQVRQIGVMKAVGGGAGQIMLLYLALIFIFSLAALLVAIPLAAYSAQIMAGYLARLINFDLSSFTLPPYLALIELAVGLVVPLAATLYPIYAGTRITIREAIASYGLGEENMATDLVNRLLVSVRGLPRPLLLSLRNAFRRKARLVLTLVTLILGGMMFIAIINLYVSTLDTLDVQMEAFGRYDVQIILREAGRLSVIEEAVAQTPGVVAWEAWGSASGRRVRSDGFEGTAIPLVGVPTESRVLEPILLEGRWLQPGDQNALVVSVYTLTAEPDLRVGDEVTIKLNGRKSTWQIVGITNGPLGERIVYTPFAALAYETRQVNRAQNIFLHMDSQEPVTQAQTASLAEQRFTAMGLDVSQVRTATANRERVMSEVRPVAGFLIVMAVLLAIIGGIGLVGTMTINVLERTREIGVLRAIGASDGTVRRIIIAEGLIVGVVSWFFSALLAWPLGPVLSYQVGYAMARGPFANRFTWFSAALWLALAVVLTILATLLPARRAMRISVREALAYE
jgi:putative ABC transport system permease protein